MTLAFSKKRVKCSKPDVAPCNNVLNLGVEFDGTSAAHFWTAISAKAKAANSVLEAKAKAYAQAMD